MSFRTVNGSTYTEAGWRCCNRDECGLVQIPDLFLTETAPLRTGPPLIILGAWLFWYDRNVEEITSSVWGWSETNDVLGDWGGNNGSNHLSAVAVDVNAAKYPWGAYTMPQALIDKVERGLDLFTIDGEQGVFWGRVWDKPDEMHFQMAWPEGDPRNDQLAQKLLDGYLGIYKPAAPADPPLPPPPPAPAADAVAVLAAATGLSIVRAAQILPAVQSGLALSECTNVNRIALWFAQIGHESDNFNATEEYDKGDGGLTERWKYLGRTWIQITWLSNYAGFSQWAFDRGLCPTPTYFVDNPTELAELQYAGAGPAWYWTVARPQINAMCDNRDLLGVTKAINGGTNGLDDRTNRWNRALAQGDALLTLTTETGDDLMSALSADEQREVLFLLREIAGVRRESRSRLRWPHQGPVDTCAGFAWNGDAFGHEASVETSAVESGHPVAIANLYAVINTDEPGREADIEFAKRILARVPKKYITAAQAAIQTWLDAAAAFNGVVTP